MNDRLSDLLSLTLSALLAEVFCEHADDPGLLPLSVEAMIRPA